LAQASRFSGLEFAYTLMRPLLRLACHLRPPQLQSAQRVKFEQWSQVACVAAFPRQATCSRGIATAVPINVTRASDLPWDDPARYTTEEIASWRAAFRFPRRYHSLADFGYTDDELLAWRNPFDDLALDDRISFSALENFVHKKYDGLITASRLSRKVERCWAKFGKKRGFINFGDFVAAGMLIDVDSAKEKIRQEGADATFSKYAKDGIMSEEDFSQLMSDFHFTVVTGTDMRKLISVADVDRNGLVDLSEFIQWAEGTDVLSSVKPCGSV